MKAFSKDLLTIVSMILPVTALVLWAYKAFWGAPLIKVLIIGAGVNGIFIFILGLTDYFTRNERVTKKEKYRKVDGRGRDGTVERTRDVDVAIRLSEEEISENKRRGLNTLILGLVLFLSFWLPDSFEIQSSKYLYVTTKSGMNIRSMPSTNSQVVSLIPFGDKFEIKEIGKKATLYGISSNWMKIQYKNIEGWVWAGYTSENEP